MDPVDVLMVADLSYNHTGYNQLVHEPKAYTVVVKAILGSGVQMDRLCD